jgi:hypothetical protein
MNFKLSELSIRQTEEFLVEFTSRSEKPKSGEFHARFVERPGYALLGKPIRVQITSLMLMTQTEESFRRVNHCTRQWLWRWVF